MSRAFEELGRAPSPMGDIVLRRRLEPSLQVDVWEVKLGDEFLMTSLFTAGETALATLGLQATDAPVLDVLVGGLGLGYTARAVLTDQRVRSLHVVEALGEVIDWHRGHLVPLGAELSGDARCRFIHGNFFAMAADGLRIEPDGPPAFHAVLVDIDHSPRHLLDPSHASFYTPDGLRRLAGRLHRSGVFALWSNDPPDDEFVDTLSAVFATAEARVVTFPNFYQGRDASSTIYVAVTGPAAG